MNTTTPFITKKFPIEVPLHEVYSSPCVFRLRFGKERFYIAKGKSLLQACEIASVSIERGLRTGNNDPADWFFHVINYINRAGIKRAKAEIVFDGNKKPYNELLKAEQMELDASKNNEHCLNNAFDSYIPDWMHKDYPSEVKIFNNWKNDTKKSKCAKNRAANTRKKHKRGSVVVRSKRRIS